MIEETKLIPLNSSLLSKDLLEQEEKQKQKRFSQLIGLKKQRLNWLCKQLQMQPSAVLAQAFLF
jgi:hypothetical protein